MDAIGELEGQIIGEVLDKVTRRGEEIVKRLLEDACRPTAPRMVARSASAAMDAVGPRSET